MMRRGQISRTRRAQIVREARRVCSLARAQGRTVDEIQDELLRTFHGELAAGEARMHALGWTIGVVREGLQALGAEDGLDSAGLQDVDVSRWLRGEVYPRESLDRLCRLFRCDQAQLGWPARGNDLPISYRPGAAADTAHIMALPAGAVGPMGASSRDLGHRRDWAGWFGVALSRLIALLDRWEDAPSCEALQNLVHQEVLMFDAVRPPQDDNEGYGPSRRQLLVTLLALPVALSPSLPLGIAPAALVRRMLAECSASITAAWHLLRQSDLAVVEQHVSSYLLALAALARQPSQHQAEAARLASQAHRVLGIVAMHRHQFVGVDRHYRQALLYAEIADDPGLQASVLLAASSHALINGDDLAAAAANHQRLLHHEPRISALQRSKLHASLAMEFAKRRQDADALWQLDVAEVEYPQFPEHDPAFARADFGSGQLVLFRGLTHLSLAREFPDRHHQQQAWDTFEQVRDLAGHAAVAERIRVEILNHQAATALEMRDLERLVACLRSGVEGAHGLGSRLRLHEAETTWRRACEVWPAEARVTRLAEMFSGPAGHLIASQP